MIVRTLVPSDAALFQSLRLLGLRECPTAFVSSFDEERDRALPDVAERLTSREDRAVFGAFDGNELAGLLGIKRQDPVKLSHKEYLWGMYVAPAARNQGVGRQLVTSALSFAATQLRVRLVTLGVNAENVAAIALYERTGFKSYRREPCFMVVDGVPQDELQMVRFLAAESAIPADAVTFAKATKGKHSCDISPMPPTRPTQQRSPQPARRIANI